MPLLRLSSGLFKLGTRLVVGLNASLWAGTKRLTQHGANVQCTSLENLHAVAQLEGHLPETVHNTPKKTKNSTVMALIIWLLFVLMHTSLCECQVHFLMVGHTRNEVAPLAVYCIYSGWVAALFACAFACVLTSQHVRTGSSPESLQRLPARSTSPCRK